MIEALPEGAERHFILPGELRFSRKPARIATLLGSCVSVCIFDRKNRWGGMNHFMLPEMGSGQMEPDKYGDQAIAHLLRVADGAGSARKDLAASVFGGGRVIGRAEAAAVAGISDIGDRNIEAALRLVRAAGLDIVRQDTGGTNGRKLHLDTWSGEVAMSFIQHAAGAEAPPPGRPAGEKRIRVLVVDDSRLIRRSLAAVIRSAPDMEVAGEAGDPFEARERILAGAPDVITLDMVMPNMDGLSFLRKLMRHMPIPTIAVSTLTTEGSELKAHVLAAGAVAVLDKNALRLDHGMEEAGKVILPLIRTASRTKVRQLNPA